MIKPKQINSKATLETLSSFVKSSPLQMMYHLKIQQINILLYCLDAIYSRPVNQNQRSRDIMRQVLYLRKGDLMQKNPSLYFVKQKQYKIKNDKNSRPQLQQESTTTILSWLKNNFFSNKPVGQSPVMEKQKQSIFQNKVQLLSDQEQQSFMLLPVSNICSKSKKEYNIN